MRSEASRHSWRVAALALSLSATFASTAQAESYAPPDAPYDASTCGFLVIDVTPAAGSIPANLPFIELAPYTLGEDIARTAELIRRDTTERVPLTVALDAVRGRLRLVLGAELVVGQTYDFVDPVCLERMRRTTTYTVTARLPEPTTLGTLEARRIYARYPALGSPRETFVDTQLSPDASMTPWAGFYAWSVTSPSEAFRQAPRLFTTDPASYAWPIQVQCPTQDTMVLPFVANAQTLLATNEITTPPTRGFRCGDADVYNAAGELLTAGQVEAYEAALRDGGVVFDAGARVAETGSPDAGSSAPDAATISIDGGRHTEPDTNPNCGCRATSSRTSTGLTALILSTLSTVALRRRRQSNSAYSIASKH